MFISVAIDKCFFILSHFFIAILFEHTSYVKCRKLLTIYKTNMSIVSTFLIFIINQQKILQNRRKK